MYVCVWPVWWSLFLTVIVYEKKLAGDLYLSLFVGYFIVYEKEKLAGRDPDKEDEEAGFGEFNKKYVLL